MTYFEVTGFEDYYELLKEEEDILEKLDEETSEEGRRSSCKDLLRNRVRQSFIVERNRRTKGYYGCIGDDAYQHAEKLKTKRVKNEIELDREKLKNVQEELKKANEKIKVMGLLGKQ